MTVQRYNLIDGELMPDVNGEYVKYTDYKKVEDAHSKAVSDASWAAEAERERAYIDSYREGNW